MLPPKVVAEHQKTKTANDERPGFENFTDGCASNSTSILEALKIVHNIFLEIVKNLHSLLQVLDCLVKWLCSSSFKEGSQKETSKLVNEG